MAKFKYGVNTNALPKGMSYPEIVRMLSRTKVNGIEWGLPSLEQAPQAVKEMAKASNDYGLEILGFTNAGHLWKTDLIRQWSDTIKPAGGKMLRVTPPWVAWNFEESLHQPESYPDLAKKTREGLERLVPLGKEYGIKYVVEMHSGNISASAPLVKQIIDGLDSNYIGVIYDPANGIHEGWLRPRNVVELLGNHLAYVHAKNITWQYSGNHPDGKVSRALWEVKTCPLEYGIVDYVEVFFALNLVGFKGWVSLEEYFCQSPEIEIVWGLDFLKKCEEAAPAIPLEPYTKFNE